MRALKAALFIMLFPVLGAWIINAYMIVKTRPYIYRDHEKVPEVEAVLIPGASVYRSGDLSPVLKQRVEVGIQHMYPRNSMKILFSGHTIPGGYNEPAAMADFAKKRLVPSEKILQDSNGTSTYFSLLNCKKTFNLNPVLIVTQEYHLPRALYIAHDMGLEAYGLVTPGDYNMKSKSVFFREIASRIKDFFLLKLFGLFRE
ncbi:vancomycin high temperature exclusion protein [Fibrobacterota bacterium]